MKLRLRWLRRVALARREEDGQFNLAQVQGVITCENIVEKLAGDMELFGG